ncbi:MAG: hypothetical protein WEE89_16460 [Gemmatimonadota bacterium]
MKLRALILMFTLTGLACGTYGSEPLPLTITVNADKLETVPGDSVSFQIVAQGGRLDMLRIDWGDGSSLDESALSARTLSRRVKHAYESTGTFEVKATISDSFAGQKAATPLSLLIR